MSKFLRKYQSWILVIGGALLMIAFLVPQAIQSFGSDRTGVVRYTLSNGRTITEAEFADSGRLYKSLQSVLPGFLMLIKLDPREPLHWLLQVEMAREGGYMGSRGDGADAAFIEESALTEATLAYQERYRDQWQLYWQYQPEERQRIVEAVKASLAPALRGGVSAEGVRWDEMLAQARGVRRMHDAFIGIPVWSEPRLKAQAKRLYDAATIDVLVVPPDEAGAAALSDPTPEEVAAHFQKYKDVPQGTGESGIGYTMPARAAVQWLTLDRAALLAAARPDPVEVQRQLLAQPAGGEEARSRKARIENELRQQMARRAMQVAEDVVKNEVLLAAGKLPDRPGRTYKVVPPEGAGVDFAALGQEAARRAAAALGAGVTLAPFAVQSAELNTLRGLSELPGIGRAILRMGSAQVPAAALFVSAMELSPAQTPPIPVQVGLPIAMAFEGRPAEGAPEGDKYFAVVTRVRAGGPPTGLDEVKDEVVADVRRLTAYKNLVERGEALALRAREISLEDVAAMLKGQNPKAGAVRTKVRVSRSAGLSDPDRAIKNEAFVDAVMQRAASLDPTLALDPRDPALTFTVPLPGTLSLALVQITAYDPVTVEAFRDIAIQARTQATVREVQPAMDEPFALPALAKRYGVELKSRDED